MSMVDKIKARLVEDAADWSAALPHWVPSLLGTTSLFATVMAAASRVVKQTPKP